MTDLKQPIIQALEKNSDMQAEINKRIGRIHGELYEAKRQREACWAQENDLRRTLQMMEEQKT